MAYGIEIFNSSGVKVLELSNRVPRFVQNGTGTVAASSTSTVSVTGMQNNDSWNVFVYESGSGFAGLTVTKNTGSFTITNTYTFSRTYYYWVVRS
jgi:hypothetical protein